MQTDPLAVVESAVVIGTRTETVGKAMCSLTFADSCGEGQELFYLWTAKTNDYFGSKYVLLENNEQNRRLVTAQTRNVRENSYKGILCTSCTKLDYNR